MPNIRLIIEYNGANFSGWQIQPGRRTIQGEITKNLRMVLREEIPVVHASGRTDAGVHARGQVISFQVSQVPDLHRLVHSISSLMKGEVAVVSAEVVPDDFHPRRNSRSKQYSYTILHRKAPPTLDKGLVWHIGGPLNIDLMQQQAEVLRGTHDFTSLRAGDCQAESPIRTIFSSEFRWEDPYLIYTVVGSGFLKQMVRIIVGTLVDIGSGRLENSSMLEILNRRNRVAAGRTAPAHGLRLDWVRYES